MFWGKSEDSDEVSDDGADEVYRPRARRSSRKTKKVTAMKIVAARRD